MASRNVTPTAPSPGESVIFGASESSDTDGSSSSYEWVIDVTTKTGETVTYTFSDAGEYTVELTVTDSGGATDTTTQTVSITSSDSSPGGGSPLPGVTGEYDADNDGEISIAELGQSASDYANGDLSIAELGEIAATYANS